MFKKDSCRCTAALMQPSRGKAPSLFYCRSLLPPAVTPPPPPVRHQKPCCRLYWETKWGPTAILPQLLQQTGSRLGSRVKSLRVPAPLPANAAARKSFEFRQHFSLCWAALRWAQPKHEPRYCLELKFKTTEEVEMQSKVTIKVFFLLPSYVIQHRLAVKKTQKNTKKKKREVLIMHFSIGTVIKPPLSYDHRSCIQKHFCVCVCMWVCSKEKELKNPNKQKATHLA